MFLIVGEEMRDGLVELDFFFDDVKGSSRVCSDL